jgi:hypothetical protein
MSDLFDRFHRERSQDNWSAHFTGLYRGIVVETNDPLRMHRIRVRIPDMYRKTEPAENILWASTANWFGGGPMGGSWVAPSIGDVVWVAFEKGHPYSPVVVGYADPTRTKRYVHDSLYGPVPVPFDEKGEIAERPEYDNDNFLPKDHRPYSMGFRSPYGQEVILNYTGFFPKAHAAKPAEAGTDPVSNKEFEVSKKAPEANKPDTKFMALVSGYGTSIILHDAGHEWQEEMKGDAVEDEDYLIDRYKYGLDFLNEMAPEGRDQRRFEVRTRAGHKIEVRDVGWNKSREGEYGKQVTLSKKQEDERWIKMRTKGGHISQMIDVGFDPEKDKFYKRLNKSEFGVEADHEDEEIEGRDKRMIRNVSRHGHGIYQDDRGSDSKDADGKAEPRGVGILQRTRQGATFAMIDKKEMQGVSLQNPDGSGFESSLRHGYTVVTTRPAETNIVDPGEIKYAPFYPRNPVRGEDIETTSHHLMLDEKNCSARLKTAKMQGIEFHDTCPHSSCKRVWGEMRDEHDRGIYFATDKGYAIWRGKPNADKKSKQWVVIDDNGDGKILVRNETGSIQIVADQNTVEIRGRNISLHAEQRVSIKAGREVVLDGGGTHWTVQSGQVGTEGHLLCSRMSGTHTAILIPEHPKAPAPPAPLTNTAEEVTPESVEEHKPEDEKKEDCKEKDEYKKAKQEAEDAKKKADESKKKADEAFEKAQAALSTARAANKAQKAAKGTSGHGALVAAFKASVAAYGKARQANREANQQYRDDKEAANEAQKKADKICGSGARTTQRGCAPNKSQMGPVPPMGGGGGPGGNTPSAVDDGDEPIPEIPPSDETSTESGVTPPPPFEPDEEDPLTGGDAGAGSGVLWYGVSETWLQEILDEGLLAASLANLLNDPANPTVAADHVELALTLEEARGKVFVQLSQKRYGGRGAILRIRAVEDADLLADGRSDKGVLKTMLYFGDIPAEFIEVFEMRPELPTATTVIV